MNFNVEGPMRTMNTLRHHLFAVTLATLGSTAAMAAMPGMDHGTMSMDQPMQGGSAPADARDPHAYSGGFTLQTGPYAMDASKRLRLADEASFGTVLIDNLELVRSQGSNSGAYDVLAKFGHDYNKLVIKAEGEASGGKLQEARTEALWSHAVSTFWDTQVGVRHDSGVGADRSWLAFGVQGLAPYWFEVDATAYLGPNGRSAIRLGAEYELLITQRLILQPRIETNWYGKADAGRDLGKGFADLKSGLRLRYEFSRQFAPYVGVEWSNTVGDTADLARAAGERVRSTRYVAGVRMWF